MSVAVIGSCLYLSAYRIAGYFCGVPIFVIFVVNRRVTKFSTHEFYDLLYKVERHRAFAIQSPQN